MILEHAVLRVRPGLADEFRAAFVQASPIIEASPGFRSLQPLACIEDEERFLLLVKWDRRPDIRRPATVRRCPRGRME